MEICKLEHIRKDYKMGEVVTPLKDLTLTVCEGDFIAVEGPSGIGKSTLLYVMGTLLQSAGLMPGEILKISEELCPKMKDIFGAYGLTIVTESSANSILQGLVVKEAGKN